MTLVDKIIKYLDGGEYVVGIFLDFSKALDTVNHIILLKKLSNYGIRGQSLSLFQSYLDNSLSPMIMSALLLKKWNMVSHKGHFWDHYSFYFI